MLAGAQAFKAMVTDCRDLDAKVAVIKEIENNGDRITRLFDEEKDPIRILKLKEIYENLEEATDCCEDVDDVIESVILKNS